MERDSVDEKHEQDEPFLEATELESRNLKKMPDTTSKTGLHPAVFILYFPRTLSSRRALMLTFAVLGLP